jgi:hypothetical protein
MISDWLKRTQFLRNWLSLAGLIILIGSIFAFLLLFAIDAFVPTAAISWAFLCAWSRQGSACWVRFHFGRHSR